MTSHRALGIIGMLAAPMMLVEGLVRTATPDNGALVAGIELFYLIGWLCSIVGMRQLRATGDREVGRIALVVQIIWLLIAGAFTVWEWQSPTAGERNMLFLIADMAWPLSHLFMIVIGVVVVVVHRWKGSYRFTPLIPGLALPIAMGMREVAGDPAMGIAFGVVTTVGFLLLGNAVRTMNVQPDSTPDAATPQA